MSKTCTVENCNGKHMAKGYCCKHYNQIRKYGHILERTIHDPNEIIEHEDYAEIVLYDKQCNEVARALIDLEHVDSVKKYKWRLKEGYVFNDKVGASLHRFLMNPPKDMVVDHINHNRLDNRICNLRICTQHENCLNKSIQCNNISGIAGVSKTRWNTWQAQIQINGELLYLGCFSTLEEAAEVRRQAEIEYFGEFAPNRE